MTVSAELDSRWPARPRHTPGRALSDLADRFQLTGAGRHSDARATGVSISASDVRPGDLFAAVPGAHRHGASFADAARLGGAVGVVTDSAGALLARDVDLPVLIADDPRSVLGELSASVYRTGTAFRALFGVTGTNGKTSTVYLLEALMRRLGMTTGLSATIEQHIGDVVVPTRLTTPEACDLHGLLARMREDAVEGAAVEISAQALSHRRVDGIHFDVVAFTNLSHDHLDEYAGLSDYLDAKVSLFRPEHASRAVVSLDSPAGESVAERALIPVVTISSSGTPADWAVEILDEQVTHTGFRLTGPGGRTLSTRVDLVGAHLAADAALAIVMLTEAGFDLGEIARSVGDDGIRVEIPGRVERVSGAYGPLAFIDIGHTPDAVLNTLRAVRRVTSGRVLTLIGADGDRDPSKREAMGRVASALSDAVVITDHHSRFEDPARIRSMLRAGAEDAGSPAEIHEIPSSFEAVRFTVARAYEGDSIVWVGPGDSVYRDIRGVRTEYSARDELTSALVRAARRR